MNNLNDTIAAIATPFGKGAISIIRISGPDSIKILKNLFQPDKNKDFTKPGVYKGKIIYNNKIIDEVVVIVYRAPKSFTGEDLVEVNCHGGIIVTNEVLNIFIKSGARFAKPGEFTLRAFLNKKIDLVQAEAINEIVNAKTEKFKDYAISNLFGKFSNYINNIAQQLKNLIVRLEVSIDHPDEDIEFITKEEIKSTITEIIKKIDKLLATSETGKSLNYGIIVVIVGKTNSGKSTLFNALLKKDKAITSDIPGTTRDILEEWINIKGIPVKIVDTAGFKDETDKIEKIALKKTEDTINSANLIIALFDSSLPLNDIDRTIIEKLKKYNKKIIYAVNKIDLPAKIDYNEFKKLINSSYFKISAIKEYGIENIENEIYKSFFDEKVMEDANDLIITNIRYENLLKKCKDYLKEALNTIDLNLTEDLIVSDIRRALKELQEITGEFTTEDLLSSIFSNFCIGK